MTELQLGNVTYNQQQLLDILHEPVRGNGLLILAHQLIAAKLNIAAGADPSCIEETIAEADALIGDLVIPPVGDGYLSPRDVALSSGDSWRLQRRRYVRSSVRSQSFPNYNSDGTTDAP